MKLAFLKETSPDLRRPAEVFDFANPPCDPIELAVELSEIMIKHNGFGLAAPQMGIPYSVFVVGDPENKESIMAFFNSSIVNYSEEEETSKEVCLSFPKLYIPIKRSTKIRMRFTDLYNETTTNTYAGFTARAIQHEYDHVLGVVFTSKAISYHLVKARKDQKLALRRRKN